MKFISAVIIVLGLVVAFFLGWRWYQGERLQQPPRVVEGQMNSSQSPAAAISVASASAAKEVFPSNSQFAEWKAVMTQACENRDKAVHTTLLDVNDDSKADLVCWRTFKTTDWEFFELQARVQTDEKGLQTAYAILPVHSGYQYGVCGPAEGLHPTLSRWTRKQVEDAGLDYYGPVSLTIAGGDCDPAWFFWPKDAVGSEVRFDFSRM